MYKDNRPHHSFHHAKFQLRVRGSINSGLQRHVAKITVLGHDDVVQQVDKNRQRMRYYGAVAFISGYSRVIVGPNESEQIS